MNGITGKEKRKVASSAKIEKPQQCRGGLHWQQKLGLVVLIAAIPAVRESVWFLLLALFGSIMFLSPLECD